MMKWQNVSVKIRTSVLLKNINLNIQPGDVLGIIGPNGSGKTILAKAIAGEIKVSGEVAGNKDLAKKQFVPFHSSLALSNGHAVYRQQRWNKIDTELLPKVNDELKKCENDVLCRKLLEKFGLNHLLDSFVINLSNGEQRKLELTKALSTNPDLLVLDNAFTGLDRHSRFLLTQMLETLIDNGPALVMTGLTKNDFPPSVKKFLVLNEGEIVQICSAEELKEKPRVAEFYGKEPVNWKNHNYPELVYLKDVTLQYGTKIILNHINWRINAGERWVLTGPNGSGKTSLLNLIFGDNPKAYQSNIRLFGKQKGSGESIWDIKANIGFISPELHQYVLHKQPVINTICSGFNNMERSYKSPTGYERDVALRWLKKLNYLNIADRLFGELSTSAQRIVLIIRTLVKHPPLLILDEPFQGLDSDHVRLLKDLLNQIASESNCAMVFVTHVPEEIPECFKFFLELDNGAVLK